MLKKIASNTLAQLVAKFFGAGLTLLTTYFLIRQAGLDLFGDLTKILVLVAVGFTAIDFGLNAEAIRSASNDFAMKKILQNVFFARLLLSFIVVIVLNLIVQFLPGGYSTGVKSVFWLGSLAIIFQGIYTSGNAWFQYKLTYWRSTVSVIIGSLVGSGLTLYNLHYCPALSNFVLANTLGYFAMAVTTLLLIPNLSLNQFRLKPSLSIIRGSLILGLILIASVVASKIDTVILGIFRHSSEVGQYGFAYRIFDVILVLPVFVMNIIYPLSLTDSRKNPHSKLIKNTTSTLAILGLFTAFFLWISAPLIDYVKPGMTTAIAVLKILSYALPFFYMTAPLMWSLIAKKRDRVVFFVYLLGALLNTALNLLFVSRYGAVASAWNTGATELFIFLALLSFSRRA